MTQSEQSPTTPTNGIQIHEGPVYAGQAISIPDSVITDPSKVLGHPSNPYTKVEVAPFPNVPEQQVFKQKPLTEEQIGRMALHRGNRPTDEEIRYMNDARERGIHHDIV